MLWGNSRVAKGDVWTERHAHDWRGGLLVGAKSETTVEIPKEGEEKRFASPDWKPRPQDTRPVGRSIVLLCSHMTSQSLQICIVFAPTHNLN